MKEKKLQLTTGVIKHKKGKKRSRASHSKKEEGIEKAEIFFVARPLGKKEEKAPTSVISQHEKRRKIRTAKGRRSENPGKKRKGQSGFK